MFSSIFILPIFSAFFLFTFGKSAYAASWYYPIDRYFQRQTVKGFGQFINNEFYKDKEKIFPFNRFYGYHAGVDLEVFENEKNKDVLVYAVSEGTIIYIGQLEGYGGVILQKIDKDHTALYGHVKIKNLPFKPGDEVKNAGQQLTLLGDEFSLETSKERKHLHFAIHKGTELYFKGHEPSLVVLNKKWENPSLYLEEKGAKEKDLALIQPTSIENKINNSEFFYTIIKLLRNLLNFFKI